MSDPYRTVTTRFRGKTDKAIFVDRPPSRGKGEVSIPRSLLHGADDLKVDHAEIGEQIEFRLRGWKCDEFGFA